MVTRVRIEAEGSSPSEVEGILAAMFEHLVAMPPGTDRNLAFGGGGEALADAQAGEFVIERFAKDVPPDRDGKPGPGYGAIFYRGRMVSHYATPSKPLDLRRKQSSDPYHEG